MCEAKDKEKTVPASDYNACVDDFNECRALLQKSNEDLAKANIMIDELANKKCPSRIKEEALIGVIVGVSCLLLGTGLGFYFGFQMGR